jgi:hypothetical protein
VSAGPKAKLRALEKIFACEIEDRLPFQSKAAIYRQLLDEGLVDEMERHFGSGWSSVTVKGYCLTHAGRLKYCESC